MSQNYAVIRSYSGKGAVEVFDRIVAGEEDVKRRISAVDGFVSYTLVRTSTGGATVTVCRSKAGTDQSIQVARDWIQANASELNAAPPTVIEGPAGLYFT